MAARSYARAASSSELKVPSSVGGKKVWGWAGRQGKTSEWLKQKLIPSQQPNFVRAQGWQNAGRTLPGTRLNYSTHTGTLPRYRYLLPCTRPMRACARIRDWHLNMTALDIKAGKVKL